jgi:hypothetical protein
MLILNAVPVFTGYIELARRFRHVIPEMPNDSALVYVRYRN